MKELQTPVHVSYTVPLACPATASGCAAVLVRCQGCSHPAPRTRRQTALSFSRPLQRPGAGLSTRADSQRLVAHDKVQPRR